MIEDEHYLDTFIFKQVCRSCLRW